jgi:1-deoxy-D-xylulose-5-phosphate reductoisomerase
MESVTPAQALNHPTWRMGKRITIDCATLMNKGFEVIEACWLFGFAPSQVDVVIHAIYSTRHDRVFRWQRACSDFADRHAHSHPPN